MSTITQEVEAVSTSQSLEPSDAAPYNIDSEQEKKMLPSIKN